MTAAATAAAGMATTAAGRDQTESGDADYAELARQLTSSWFISDPWLDGQPRFSARPAVVARADYRALADAAENVAAVLDEMCGLVAAEPALLETFFRLTPVQRLMFETSYPLWHGHARADVFRRAGLPPVVCEINCDTPSGQPEAVALGQLATRPTTTGGAAAVAAAGSDPAAALPDALGALIGGLGRQIKVNAAAEPADRPLTVGVIYPTEMTEDLALVTLLRSALEARGAQVVLGSPFNLHATAGGGVGLFGAPVDVVVRHYKTDWWGEREPLWRDEAPYPDADPLGGPLGLLLAAELEGRCAVVNPFGAVLPQNKRAYAFLWERRRLFSPGAQAIIEAHVPPTFRLEIADRNRLLRERPSWVLKSDYGCEGEEVLIGAALDDDEWREALALAIPHRFVAQRRFDPVRDGEGRAANHGVFLVAGRAAGAYTRLSVGATDRQALSVPTVVAP